MKKCVRCSATKALSEFGPAGKRSYCRPCCARLSRERYTKNKAYRKAKLKYYSENKERVREARLAYDKEDRLRHPEKHKARNMTNYAVKKGRLVRCRCLVCGKKKVDAHHQDYTKPLEVLWLCRPHHRTWERLFL